MAKKNIRFKKGIFITFEGSEGSGKSTQLRLIYNHLKKKGLNCVYIREPGGTFVSEKIRKILLDPKNSNMSHVTEMFLYMAARNQIIESVIKPALRDGRVVLCDRFHDSTVVYQGYGLGIDLGLIKCIGKIATSDLVPDLTVLLDIPCRLGLKRAGKIKDRIERRSIEYHRRVRRGYLDLARKFPKRIKLIKVGGCDKHAVALKIREVIKQSCLLKI